MTQKVFGFAGWSGSGKTTLIEQIVAHISAGGHRVSLIKHAHHEFDVDVPGKDSYRHRQAGANEVLVTSARRFALMRELRGDQELSWQEAVAQLSPCDLVLIEGFKRAPIPKLEIWRAEVGKPLLFPTDAHIQAIASDDPLPSGLLEPKGRRFSLTDIAAISDFIRQNARAI